LLAGCARAGSPITREELDEIVSSSDKQRFALSPDGTRIRANQGHSVEVRLDYAAQTPPEVLFHGTATRFVGAIREQGLAKGARHHVHLSADEETARKVGQRHGRPVILHVRSGAMCREGHEFFRSANGVWLTESVPAAWLIFPENEA
jgi:putative RNA 2'-phosphotransferase